MIIVKYFKFSHYFCIFLSYPKIHMDSSTINYTLVSKLAPGEAHQGGCVLPF